MVWLMETLANLACDKLGIILRGASAQCSDALLAKQGETSMNTSLRGLAAVRPTPAPIYREGGKLPATARPAVGPDPLLADGANFAEGTIAEDCYEFAGFRLLPGRRTLLHGGDRVAIGGRALDLLSLLVSRAGNVVSFGDLMRLVWPNVTVEEANVRVQMNILRKILSQWDDATRAINTVPNRGYCFVLPVRHHPTGVVRSGSSSGRRIPALPMLANKIVGRDDAIQIIENALVDNRLVTINGPG
jgi:DNA-binding winged helix-turn-helix (wHTH) protein